MIWFDVEEYLPDKECDLIGLIPDTGIRILRFVPADDGIREFFVPGDKDLEAFPVKWMTNTMAIGHVMKDEGWEVHETGGLFLPEYLDCDVAIHPQDTLYRVRHFGLVWRVLRWAIRNDNATLSWGMTDWLVSTDDHLGIDMYEYLMRESPEMAISWILNKVIELSIGVNLLHE